MSIAIEIEVTLLTILSMPFGPSDFEKLVVRYRISQLVLPSESRPPPLYGVSQVSIHVQPGMCVPLAAAIFAVLTACGFSLSCLQCQPSSEALYGVAYAKGREFRSSPRCLSGSHDLYFRVEAENSKGDR
jgi:hypothetical protein